jgi:hypothetical protein
MKIYYAIFLLSTSLIAILLGNWSAGPFIEIGEFKINSFFSFFVISVGLFFALIGAYTFIQQYAKHIRMRNNGIFTKGTVKRIDVTDAGTDEDGYRQYKSKVFIDFRDNRGIPREALVEHTGGPTSYKEGDIVPMKFNRNDPSDYLIGSSTIGFILGFVIFVVGLGIMILSYKFL